MNAALQTSQLNTKRKLLWETLKTTISPDAKKLEWYEIADILDDHAPEWKYAIKNVAEIGSLAVVIAAITIEGVTREGTGSGSAESESGIKIAEGEALKSAAAKFGIRRLSEPKSLELVGKKTEKINIGFEGDPVAKNGHDFCTAKQIGMMRSICRELDCDLEDKCNQVFPGIKTDQLSKRAASSFIQYLQELEKQGQLSISRQPPSTVSNFPQSSDEFNPAQNKQIEQWREEIRLGTGKTGLNPLEYLPEFDTHSRTFGDKKKTYDALMLKVAERQREQIKKGLAEQNWSNNHRDAEFAKHGIRTGLQNATPQQIDRMWTDFKRTRII